MSGEGVCRTAPATPGLLNTGLFCCDKGKILTLEINTPFDFENVCEHAKTTLIFYYKSKSFYCVSNISSYLH